MADADVRIRLEPRRVSSLLPHEETIDSKTEEMAEQLRRDGVQKDPLIVDQSSGVVLDGMHRLSAFVRLGIKNSVCYLVPYDSPGITLGRWLRVYKVAGEGKATDMMREVGLTEKRSRTRALDELERRDVPVAGFAAGVAFLPRAGGGLEEGFAVVRRADRFAEAQGWKRGFHGEEELENHLKKKDEVVFLVGKLDKRDVIMAGKTRRPFPCKTSMHVVDPRPVAANVPLGELEADSSAALLRRLNRRRFEMLPPNSFYEGRKYKERLLLLAGS